MLTRHLSVALLAATTGVAQPAPVQAQGAPGATQFVITLRGVRIGSEYVTVTRTGGTFKVSSTGQLAPPYDFYLTKFELTYAADWQPQQLIMEGAVRNQTLNLSTTFGLTTASNETMQGDRRGGSTHDVTPRVTVLPLNFFAAYEALAARLAGQQASASMPVYIAPEGQVTAMINRITPRIIARPSGTTTIQEYDLTLNRPGLPLSVLVWVDAGGRLARVEYRDSGMSAIREDFATVMAREVRVRNAGDEDVFIPASGFNLASTITKPAPTASVAASGRMPVVILVGGPGRQDRDETLYSVPLFGQLAGRLAEAGYFVVRYDKRGVGQSGGRPEHAGLEEYAEDVVGIVSWLRKRKDIDPDRIALVSHGEGSAVALLAAGREKRIRGVALLSATGLPGREAVLEQQRLALARMNETPANREAKIDLQTRVINAVITGSGWDTIPADVRRQAETPWFKAFLQFDPAAAMKKVSQRLLVVHGALDQQVAPANSERLATIGAARKDAKPADTSRVVVPAVNHLLLAATTGDVEEYASLAAQPIAPDVVAAIVNWLNAPRK